MSDKSFVSLRVDSGTKEEVEIILEEMGMNMTTAVNIYLKAIQRYKGIPFMVNLQDLLIESQSSIDTK